MHLYLHIPFCRQACHYCDFHFSTNLTDKQRMVEAILAEIRLQKGFLSDTPLQTVYFGGGTPSLLEESEIAAILALIHETFGIEPHAEITIEANPDDLSAQKLQAFKTVGINRLSIGIQSFNEKYLHYLNRIHTATEAQTCVKQAQDLGFENISIDLIYGIPPIDGTSTWLQDLDMATALGVPHLSAYCLTIEPQTVFGNWLRKKKIAPIDEDLAAQHFEQLLAHTQAAGYDQYEISNFAKPNRHSRHNSSYWQQKAYLGIGPAAHSYDGQGLRQYNVSHNTRYIKAIAQGKIPCTLDPLSPTDRLNEYLLTSLRTHWGTDLAKMSNDFEQTQANILQGFYEKQWIEKREGKLFLTKDGKLFADKIASELFL